MACKSCSSATGIIGLRVPTRKSQDFPLFHVSPSIQNCPSNTSATAENSVCNGFGILRMKIVTLNQIWYYIQFYIRRRTNELFKYSLVCACFISTPLCCSCYFYLHVALFLSWAIRNKITLISQKLVWKCMDWINLAQSMGQSRAVVKTAMNLL